ncbi:hypothetical protein CEE37_11545 [candidate division LCP-89 bacterium B3_LCP]|uniref:Uncharacterized protein n=1 Tax=candidate division LCP-89 bacterium B3_LCP TaxID=2012998 RepID=A0A532UVV0_UNCL8|nr:MAG: hypothetical protein CEE37_11545 [candidate division LCP-89 bacterium B3_LCP]
MADPFKICSEVGLVVHTNYKAESLKSFLNGLKKVSGSSIFYHVHHALLRRHFATSDHMNDFARWVLEALGQSILSERLASVDPMGTRSVREARNQLVSFVSEYVGGGELFFRVAEGKEFHFLELHSLIVPLKTVEPDLESFYHALKKATLGTFFFHMIEAPIRLAKHSNDFSEWLITDLGEDELAAEIAHLNPYMYNLWELKAKVLQCVRKRLKEDWQQ